MEHNIIVVLLPPHSSHLTQPLDIGIFSPLKIRIAEEFDKILRYRYSNIKKFERASCYHVAWLPAMQSSNIQSARLGTGLIPFNSQKVIRRLRARIAEEEVPRLTMDMPSPSEPPTSHAYRFSLVPQTPSKLNSTIYGQREKP